MLLVFRLGFSILFIGIALAQNCPTCGQNPPNFITPITTPIPQTVTAKIKVVLNAPANVDPNSIQIQAAPVTSTNCANGNCNNQIQVQAAPPIISVSSPSFSFNSQNAPIVSTSCSNGNCNNNAPIVVQAPSGCSSGNCNNNAPIVVAASNGCSNGNCNNNAPIVVQAPSSGCFSGNCGQAPIIVQAPSNGCFSGNCGAQPIVIPAFNSGCSGIGCGAAPIVLPSPIIRSYAPIIGPILGNSGGCGYNGCNRRSFSNFGIPDPITTNGRFFRPRVRVPIRYDNGNPVFNVNTGYGKK